MLNRLTGTSLSILDEDLYGGVNYSKDVNPYEDLEIGCAAAAEISFTTTELIPINTVLTYEVKQASDTDYRIVGNFIITNTEKEKDKYKCTGYDLISKFEKVVDSYLDGLTYPVQAGAFFGGLCTYCGCTAASTTFTNSTVNVSKNWSGANITGRQVLEWIAGLAGGFAIADNSGKIAISSYSNGATFTADQYRTYVKADYTVAAIDKLIVKKSDDDVGYSVGSGSNALVVIGNPLLVFDSAAAATTVLTPIYNKISAYGSYVPCTIDAFADNGVGAGNIITINGTKHIIMDETWSKAGAVLESNGQSSRSIARESLQSLVFTVKGAQHELRVDVDGLESRVTSAEGNITTLSTTIDGVSARVTTAEGDITALELTTEGLSTTVTAHGQTITQQGNTISTHTSQLTQQSNKISLVVSENQGQNVVNAASIVAGINDSASSVKIAADHITLDGNVVMKSNLTDGTTTISGNNLKTGTIDASTVSVTNLNASNIKAGSLDADYVDIKGDIEVYAGSTSVGFIGGSSNSVGMKSTSSNNSVTCSTSGITLGGTQLLLTNATMYGPSLPSPDDYSVGAVFFVTGS